MALEAGSQRYGAVEGLRAVAALLVLTTHVAYWTGFVNSGFLGGLAARGDLGVAVFFVLSGFLLSTPWLEAAFADRPPPGLRRYAVHRAARLLPAYYLALAAVLLTAVLSGPVDGSEVPLDPQSVTSHLLLAQAYVGPLFSTFSQTWSLTTELTFYLLLPAVAGLAGGVVSKHGPSRGLARVLLWCLAVGVVGLVATGVAAAEVVPHHDRVALSALGHAAWFAAGIAIGCFVSAERSGKVPALERPVIVLLRTSPGLLAAAAGVLLLVTITPLAGPRGFAELSVADAVAKELLYTLVAATALLSTVSRDADTSPALGPLDNPYMRYLGRISYGIFLWHLLVIQWWYSLTGWTLFTGRFWPVLALTTAGAVSVASLSYLLVERQVISRARQYQRPRQHGDRNEAEELREVPS